MKNKYSAFAPAKAIKPKPCGTILPTADSLAVNDRWHMTNEQQRKAAAHAAGLTNLVRVGLEDRYYYGDKYAVISSRDFRVLWFQVRADGDYRCKA
jgi:hypothetical protein